METQEAVMESAPVETDGQTDAKRDGTKKFTLGPNDSLEGKLTYSGSMTVDGGHAEGEFRIGGNIEIDDMANVKASLAGRDVSIHGHVNGAVVARKRLIVGRSGSLIGDVRVARLVIQDGASFSGKVSMGAGADKPAAPEAPPAPVAPPKPEVQAVVEAVFEAPARVAEPTVAPPPVA